MSGIPSTEEEALDRAGITLGDLLYAQAAKPRAAEDDCVRLVRAIAAGDQLALHALYERAHRPAFTLIVRITNNRHTAEELTVDLFYDVWRRAATYDSAGGTVLGWIMNQARSRAIDWLRYEQRQKRVDPTRTMPQRLRSATASRMSWSSSESRAGCCARRCGT